MQKITSKGESFENTRMRTHELETPDVRTVQHTIAPPVDGVGFAPERRKHKNKLGLSWA